MVGHGRLASVRMLELAVRSFLTNQIKPEVPQDSHDLIWLENRDAAAHARGLNSNCLGADKFCLQTRFAVFKQHGKHFAQILVQFI